MFRLGAHQGASGPLPAAGDVLAVVATQHGHMFLPLRPGQRRLSAADGQAYLACPAGGWWNVVRLLLEVDGRLAAGRRWMNVCGFPECVDIEHWAPKIRVNPVPRKRPRLYNVLSLEGGRFSLQIDGVDAARDATFPGRIESAGPQHLVRYLHDETKPRFVTACGINIEPRTLVPGTCADCPQCLT